MYDVIYMSVVDLILKHQRHYAPTQFAGHINFPLGVLPIDLLLCIQSANSQCFLDHKRAAEPGLTGHSAFN